MKLAKTLLAIGFAIALAANAFGQAPGQTETQPPADKAAADKAAAEKPQFTASLLLLKSDWTKVPAAQELETELRAVLKEANISEELLATLPGGGPNILFAPEIVSFYPTEQFHQFLAWLQARGLVEKIHPFPLPQDPPPQDRPGSGAPRPARQFATELHNPQTFLTLRPVPGNNTVAFISRHYELSWEVVGFEGQERIFVRRNLSLVEQSRGQEKPTKNSKQSTYCDIKLPADRLAVLNAFPHKDEGDYRLAAKGRLGVILIARGKEAGGPDSVQPKLQLPERVERLSVEQNGHFQWAPTDGRGGWGGLRGGGGRPATGQGILPGASAKPPETPAVAKEEVDLKIFHLKYASAASLERILRELFPQIVVKADERTNSLIVSGPEETLMRLEAVVVRLDETPTAKDAPQTGSAVHNFVRQREGAGSNKASESPAAQYQRLEKEINAAAKGLRGKSEAQVQELKANLRGKIAAAFEARQESLRLELAEFERRMRDVGEFIELRNRLADEIIEKRLGEVLNPGKDPAASGGAKADSRAKPGGKANSITSNPNSPARSEVEPVPDAAQQPVRQLQGFEFTQPQIASVEDMRRSLDEAEEALQAPEANVAVYLKGLRKSNPQATEDDVKKVNGVAWEALLRARRRLKVAQAQLAAQIRLLELELENAKSTLVAEQESLKLADTLIKAGEASVTTRAPLVQAQQQSRLRIDRAATLLDLYKKIAPPAEPPPPAKPN